MQTVKAINRQILLNQLLIVFLFCALAFWNTFPILLIIASFIGIIPVIFSAGKALWKREITIDLLASIALIFTIIEGQWVSAAFINLMLASARLFSLYTERKTENAIKSLLKLRPALVKIKVGDHSREVKLEEVKPRDLVVVESGERVPIDGEVEVGQASVDQSTLTGESQPVAKYPGDKVFSSTLCLTGSLLVRAEKVGEDTTLAKIIALVDEAGRLKTKTETIAGKFSSWYILATLLGSGLVYIFSGNLKLVLSILLVTCADDLAVAIPLGFTVAIAKAAKQGIVIKGSAVMERLKDIKTIVTDKTGTLTKGIFVVAEVEVLGKYTPEEFLALAGSAAIDSSHPVSKAIVAHVKSKKIHFHSPDEARESPGEGVWIKQGSEEYRQGKLAFLEKNGVRVSDRARGMITKHQAAGASITALSSGHELLGFFVLEDEIRKYAKEVVNETKGQGVKHWTMLTGDNEAAAARVAGAVGLDEFHANLYPMDKIEIIKKLKHKHGAIAMLGDGVNDAAALAMADVSFAMGDIGSDSSIQAADIALMKDDLRGVPEAIFLSRQSIKIIKQNFIIWALSNVVGLTLVFAGILNPVGASLFNFLTDFIPILNVLKIYRLKLNREVAAINRNMLS
jgi:Cd2+/Zn2+-exporting ATPase